MCSTGCQAGVMRGLHKWCDTVRDAKVQHEAKDCARVA